MRDSFNAVFVEGDAVGELMFLGRGAGGMPTASAVLGDLLDAAHNLTAGAAARRLELPPVADPPDRRPAVRLLPDPGGGRPPGRPARRRPGSSAAISVSIRSMEQEAPEPESALSPAPRPRPAVAAEARRPELGLAHLVFVTHPAYERDVQACLHELRHLDVVRRIGGLLRVVGS